MSRLRDYITRDWGRGDTIRAIVAQVQADELRVQRAMQRFAENVGPAVANLERLLATLALEGVERESVQHEGTSAIAMRTRAVVVRPGLPGSHHRRRVTG